MASDPNGGVCLIRRVVIRNYKSIAACDVELGPLTFLVGPNGSGKSNFLDALRFVSDSLHNSLGQAIRQRRGFSQVCRRSSGNPSEFGIRVEFSLPSGHYGYYAFVVGDAGYSPTIENEECFVRDGVHENATSHFYRVAEGKVLESTFLLEPPASYDRLYLVNASGSAAFRPVYDALSSMGFYNINPESIRTPKLPDDGEFLFSDGANLASVLWRLDSKNPTLKSRIEEYLAQVVPGVTGVEPLTLASFDLLQFRTEFSGRSDSLMATSMSDGTLRVLGILTSLFQERSEGGGPPLLIGLEEPESALHPAAVGVLIDAMRDALSTRQVVVTSHSPDLLDSSSIADSEILAVVAEEGETRIGHLDEAGRSVLRDHLFTPGDLLRMNQFHPNPAARSLKPEDVELFGTGAPA